MADGAQDRASFGTIPELDGTDMLQAHYTRHSFRPHFHVTYLIGVTEEGTEIFDARGARHVSTPLCLRFFNPGEVHTGGPPQDGHWTYRCLYPRQELIDHLASDVGPAVAGRVWFPDMVRPDSQLARAALGAFAALAEPSSSLERSTRFRTVITDILVRHAGNRFGEPRIGRESRTIVRAQSFISDHAAMDFSLIELSEAVGLSAFHLVRSFKAQVGLTPFAYQTQRRVDLAKRMLAQGRSVRETARLCGFYDRSHLARVFKGITGVQPRAYQKAVAPQGRTH